MAAIEQEILEGISQLEPEQKHLVLALVQELARLHTAQPTLHEWLALAESSLAETREKYGEDFTVGSQTLLDEARCS